jgi:hypothetical protein
VIDEAAEAAPVLELLLPLPTTFVCSNPADTVLEQ